MNFDLYFSHPEAGATVPKLGVAETSRLLPRGILVRHKVSDVSNAAWGNTWWGGVQVKSNTPKPVRH